MAIRDEFLIQRQGKTYALYQGLLDEAHQLGLHHVDTKILQIPSADNNNVAICKATVTIRERGDLVNNEEQDWWTKTFTGIGDASPENVGRNIAPHIIRMAETRAKARALRDAVNAGVAALEELSDDDPSPTPREARTEHSRASEGQQEPERTPGGATKKAANYLAKLLIDAGHDEDVVKQHVFRLSAKDVSEKIEEYKGKEASG